MNNNDLSHKAGSVSAIQKQTQKPKIPNKMRILTGLALVGFLYLGGLGLLCVQNGGYVGVQIRDLILTFSGQSKDK
jgi:hypothetical protein